MTRLALAGLAATLAATVIGSASVSADEGVVIRLKVNGQAREALVFAPATAATGAPAPLVLAFHGHGGNMEGFSNGLHIHDAWPEAVVVYPQGLPTVSNLDPSGKSSGWDSMADAATKPVNKDLLFVDALVADMHKRYHIDDTRIYAAGFSNGAFLSLLLWATRGQEFAAFAAIAGQMHDWKPTVPRPLLYIGGAKDPKVTPEIQKDTIEKARKFDLAAGPSQPCGNNCVVYASTAKTPVRVITHPGGHLVPPVATEAVTTFFKNHPKLPS